MRYTLGAIGVLMFIAVFLFIIGRIQMFLKKKYKISPDDPNSILITIVILLVPTIIIVAILLDIYSK